MNDKCQKDGYLLWKRNIEGEVKDELEKFILEKRNKLLVI